MHLNATAPTRVDLIDILRGAALLSMTGFHFCFDLAFFGLADFDFYKDPFWLIARTLILGSFLVLVGVSLRLAHGTGVKTAVATRRIAMIAANAVLVSAATYWMFGERWIFFGVLHFIALASVIALPLVRRPILAVAIGTGIFFAGSLSFQVFDQPALRWIGFMTHKPATEDYVPLVPWLSLVLFGIVVAPLLVKAGGNWKPVAWSWRVLAFGGRHSLMVYMLHQPLLVGALKLFVVLSTA